MKWKIYWSVAIASLAGLLYWKNNKNFKQKSQRFVIGKSAIELVMVVLMLAFAPALLIGYGVFYIVSKVKTDKSSLRIAIGVAAGAVLAFASAAFLELLALLSVFAVDIVSNEFLAYLEQKKAKRKSKLAA